MKDTRMRAERFSRVLTATLLAMVAGCSSSTPPTPTADQTRAEFAELMQRPDLTEIATRYQQMYTQLRSAFAAAYPGLTWTERIPPGGAGCGGDFAAVNNRLRETDAGERGLGNWEATQHIPDGDWKHVQEIIAGVVGPYGFTIHPNFAVDRPGAIRDADYPDAYGGELSVTVGRGIEFSLHTGCHLTPDAKRRGTPAPRPTY